MEEEEEEDEDEDEEEEDDEDEDEDEEDDEASEQKRLATRAWTPEVRSFTGLQIAARCRVQVFQSQIPFQSLTQPGSVVAGRRDADQLGRSPRGN